MQNTTRIDPADIARQRDFCAQIRERNAALPAPPLAFVDTYGCQQNEADSERIRGFLSEMGYGFTKEEAQADVIVINTCAIREHAEQRVLGNVGALVHEKKAHPGQILCLCGCMVQEPHNVEKLRQSFRHVDLVFGPHALWRFPELLWRVLTRRGRIFDTPDEAGSIAEGLPVRREGTVKAWVSIMYGCNNFCSYCIVPYVRGRERSRRPEDILSEVRELSQAGYRDITLLGQNVNSYGKDLGLPGVDFAWLLEQVNAVPGDFLIRFMTSHPKDASERLFDTMAACEKVAPHLHLPFQAGNDRVLRAMHRGYTREHYLELIRSLRARIPDIVLTSDVIVGFPGETTEEFEDTLKVLEEVEFDALFTFIYSPRKGTPAAELPDPLSKEEKAANFQRLVDLQNAISARKQAAYVGKTMRCLVDVLSEDPRHNLNARTAGGRLVHFSGDEALLGQFVDLKITDASTWALFGELA
ncbi:MAG TPA: tRNA (N6-isopentenyl adenosine(37)-C2)-methylthiotransferase MiaB [Candidatus Intestinimonas pullistercoris]|uniref:tRNA-2-methylthio-N(6)-dimethylallyladenosine synthase n=1 Tax=Candidatus Intestinimonas pullistercoris TaxID=2838623 RepID=A0A9D2P050_9FIRM|nr:tRNA (N6-isopentenyl adenosine(37)-C2)-methylthiotransferase MiaB [uncultured Intestinimonas sp.]HJC41916.1 tRNA (N6-isopentenyl adenosine(37)-C2)-methylthiotransferase MiaB [Candidatus Intestinimonas pullistercoris]